MRIGLDRRIGRADNSDQKRLPAGSARLAGDLERKRARAAQDRQRTRGAGDRPAVRRAHPSSSFPARGTQIARSPPWRRKATICCTASWPANASATSSMRSFSVPAAVEQHLVGAPQLVDRLVREAAALQADDIEPGEAGAVAERKAKGNEVMLDAGETADERVGADANELMHGGAAAQNGEIADLAMAGQHHVVGENDALADAAIMRDVGVGQEHRPRPDDRFRAAARGAGIHRHAFANDAVLADR